MADLDALAAQYGGKAAPVDYDALAKAHGGSFDEPKPEIKAKREIPQTMADKASTAIGDTAASLITGAAAAPVAGLAGIAGSVLPGPQGQGADWVNKTQDALTMKPIGGGGLTDVVTKPLQWLGKGADIAGGAATDVTGSPAVGAGVNTAIQMIPTALSGIAGPKVRGVLDASKQERAALQSRQSVKDETIRQGREAGYVVPPASMLQGIAGRKSLKDEAIIRNQEVSNNLARKAVELPQDAPITISALESKRAEFSQPYREIAALSEDHPIFRPPFKGPAETLKDLQAARAEATAYYRVNRDRPGGSPPALKRAERADARADALENSLEQSATALGRPDLIPKMREARVKLAKTYEVERALNPASGDIDAHVLGNAYDKNPKRMSGELATIGRFDQTFRKYTTELSRTESPGGSGHGADAMSIGLAAARGHPSGFWPMGVAIAGGPTRSLLLSDLYQRPNQYGPSLSNNLATGLFSENAPYGLGASLAATKNDR